MRVAGRQGPRLGPLCGRPHCITWDTPCRQQQMPWDRQEPEWPAFSSFSFSFDWGFLLLFCLLWLVGWFSFLVGVLLCGQAGIIKLTILP